MPSVTVYTIQEYFTALNSTEVCSDGCQYATCSCQVLKSAWRTGSQKCMELGRQNTEESIFYGQLLESDHGLIYVR